MSTDTFEDIEEWSLKMATRKALESVKVWDGENIFCCVLVSGFLCTALLVVCSSTHVL